MYSENADVLRSGISVKNGKVRKGCRSTCKNKDILYRYVSNTKISIQTNIVCKTISKESMQQEIDI